MRLKMQLFLVSIIGGSVVSSLSMAQESGVIIGKIKPSPQCKSGEAHLWYSQGRALIYQAEVPSNGTFEIHSVPGNFSLVVTGSTGCFSESPVAIQKAEKKELEINLNLVGKKSASIFSRFNGFIAKFALMDQVHADVFCPECAAAANFGSQPFYNTMGYYATPSFFPQAVPWWGGYGAMTYSNFYYPSAWSGGGYSPVMYPGGGMHGVGMGKPNIYVTAPSGIQVDLKVKMAPDSAWWMSVPHHGEKGWNIQTNGDGSFVSNNAKYRYLFLDYRAEEVKLQSTRGFCTNGELLLPKMNEVLKSAHFAPNEIKDFNDYWSIKMPPAQGYCVFPQMNSELDRISTLEISPAPSSVTRVAFVVVPQEAKGGNRSKFVSVPKIAWTAPSEMNRTTASASTGIIVREWGVGFLQGQ